MSASEIANNKWELEVTKPKLVSVGALSQIVMMGGFAAFFAYIVVFSVIGAFSEKKACVEIKGQKVCGALAEKYEKATHEGMDGGEKAEE